MPTPQELETRFWKALASDHTMMLGLDGVEDGHTRPMTGQFEHERGPIWFFTATDSGIVTQLGSSNRAIATFTAKGHDLFAAIRGALTLETDRAVIKRLWNPTIAAWYDGDNDPKIALLRLDAEEAEIWLDGTSLMAGIRTMLGADPKDETRANMATVPLG